MSDDLRDLYQEVILEHARKPRNFRAIEAPGALRAEGYNRLCGDRLHVYVQVEDGVITDVSFQGSGCAISTASASMMTQALKGRSVEEVEKLYESFHDLVTIGEDGGAQGAPEVDLDKLEIFAGVREFPARVKCATLAWHTMHAALEAKADAVVSTEE
jgi:nitrogen fixation protein NifU and related proteins